MMIVNSVTLSTGSSFIIKSSKAKKIELAFEKREIILIAGVLLLMIGLMSLLAPIYAVIIAILAYFAIKVYVGRKKRQIQREIGKEGICAVCGGKVTGGKCPNCDSKNKEQMG